jgi:hypothetical protein
MTITIATGGTLRWLYTEAIDLAGFGQMAITRASHLEPDDAGCRRR